MLGVKNKFLYALGTARHGTYRIDSSSQFGIVKGYMRRSTGLLSIEKIQITSRGTKTSDVTAGDVTAHRQTHAPTHHDKSGIPRRSVRCTATADDSKIPGSAAGRTSCRRPSQSSRRLHPTNIHKTGWVARVGTEGNVPAVRRRQRRFEARRRESLQPQPRGRRQ